MSSSAPSRPGQNAPAPKRQKLDTAAGASPPRPRRSAPSQVRRNQERVRRFKEKTGAAESQGVDQDAGHPQLNGSLKDAHEGSKDPKDPEAAAGAPAPAPAARKQPAATARQAGGADAPESREALRSAAAALLAGRRSLPVSAHAGSIRAALRRRDVLVLVGETGSGKSTQVPQVLQAEPWCRAAEAAGGGRVGGCVAVTEPRRVAATSLARRVAREMGSALGRASPASKVGYAVRFDDNSGARGRVRFVTDGLLLQEALRDPGLRRYSAVVVDEVHERGVNVDLLLGLLKRIVRGGGAERGGVPLKVVVMSATAEAEAIVRFFSEDGDEAAEDAAAEGKEGTEVTAKEGMEVTAKKAPADDKNTKKAAADTADGAAAAALHVGGRQHPVRIVHAPRPVPDILEASMLKIFELNFREPMPGDILVFMTGQSTVEALCALIREYGANLSKSVPHLLALPLYAALPQDAQQRVFDPLPAPHKGQRWTRKVVVSTNIAETSVTIPGVRHVVDAGKEKVKQFRPGIGLESLLTKPVSRSAAIQRAGRAGREAAGVCYRLYREADFAKLPASSVPEILRCDLSQAYIFLLARGVAAQDLATFPLLARPSREASEAALVQLHRLGAVGDDGRVTEAGTLMAALPVGVSLAKVLLRAAAPDTDCLDDAVDLVAAMSGEEIFIPRRDGDDEPEGAADELRRAGGDHAAMARAVCGFAEEHADRRAWAQQRGLSWRALREIMRIRKQLQALAPRLRAFHQRDRADSPPEASGESPDALLRCLLAGFPGNVALLDADNRYRTAGARQEIAVHPSSALHARANQSVARGAAGKPAALVYSEFVFTSKAYARGVSAVDSALVAEAFAQVAG